MKNKQRVNSGSILTKSLSPEATFIVFACVSLVVLSVGILTSQIPKRPSPQVPVVTKAEKIPVQFVGVYKGIYTVDDDQDADWKGVSSICVDQYGTVKGYAWLPSNDGGPGLVYVVQGKVEKSGNITLQSGWCSAGTRNGVTQGEGIRRFQFKHIGHIKQKNGKLTLCSTSTATAQGFPERIEARISQ